MMPRLHFIKRLNFFSVSSVLIKTVCSFSYISRRGFRLRSKKLCDAAETPPAEAEEATEEEEGTSKGDKDKQEMEKKEEEKKNEGGQVDSDDCEVCPGTEAPPFLSPTCF